MTDLLDVRRDGTLGDWRAVLCLSGGFMLFDIYYMMKGYVGGLGASAFDCLHIGLLGFGALVLGSMM